MFSLEWHFVIARTIHNNKNKIASKSSYFDPGEALGLGRAPGKLQKRLKSPSVEIASASWDQVSKVDKNLKIHVNLVANYCEECEGAVIVICKYRYILGKYNQRVKSKGNDKKVHGPTTTLAGTSRRGVFVRPGRCSCLQVTTKKTGTIFLSACCFFIFISLVTSHSVFRSPYIQLRGSTMEDKPQVYLSWNCSRTTQDWRGFPLWLGNLIWGSLQFLEAYVLPKTLINQFVIKPS